MDMRPNSVHMKNITMLFYLSYVIISLQASELHMQTSLQTPHVIIKDEFCRLGFFLCRYFVRNGSVCNTKPAKDYFTP